jgi:hypothetical protein
VKKRTDRSSWPGCSPRDPIDADEVAAAVAAVAKDAAATAADAKTAEEAAIEAAVGEEASVLISEAAAGMIFLCCSDEPKLNCCMGAKTLSLI